MQSAWAYKAFLVLSILSVIDIGSRRYMFEGLDVGIVGFIVSIPFRLLGTGVQAGVMVITSFLMSLAIVYIGLAVFFWKKHNGVAASKATRN